jgi:hypothetical protein
MISLVTKSFNLYLEVFFLLQNKHMMVEELLQLLIAEVDAQLLETVELKRRIFVKILYKIITFMFYCTVLDCFTLSTEKTECKAL